MNFITRLFNSNKNSQVMTENVSDVKPTIDKALFVENTPPASINGNGNNTVTGVLAGMKERLNLIGNTKLEQRGYTECMLTPDNKIRRETCEEIKETVKAEIVQCLGILKSRIIDIQRRIVQLEQNEFVDKAFELEGVKIQHEALRDELVLQLELVIKGKGLAANQISTYNRGFDRALAIHIMKDFNK